MFAHSDQPEVETQTPLPASPATTTTTTRVTSASSFRPATPGNSSSSTSRAPSYGAGVVATTAKPTQAGDTQRLLEALLGSLYALRETLSKSRPTRLAPGDESTGLDDHSVAPAKLVLDGGSRASSDELHLLCKLLHKQLESTSTSSPPVPTSTTLFVPVPPTQPPTNSSASTAEPAASLTSAAPTSGSSQWPRLRIGSGRELNESHGAYLLESVFARSPAKGAGGPSEPLERSARYLLEALYNKAANSARLPVAVGDGASDYAAPSGAGEAATEWPPGEPLPNGRVTLILKQWPRATYIDERRHLHLAYWLIELPSSTGSNNASQQLIEPREAAQLLGQLERSSIEAELESNRLSQVGARLVEPLLQASDPSSWSARLQPPRVIDDELFNLQQQQHHQAGSNRSTTTSGLQLLADRLANSSFVENLHLYLIILFLMLFCVILCFACPMMCCQRKPAFPVLSAAKTTRGRRQPAGSPAPNEQLGFSGFEGADESAAASGKPEPASVWRKLSNTTTTLTRDRSRLDRYEGTWRTVDNERRLERRLERAAGEDGQREQTLVYTLTRSDLVQQDARGRSQQLGPAPQVSKAVQACSPSLISLDGAKEFDRWPLDDRLHQRNSDTMSKSELVMVKEKLVPILRNSAELERPRSDWPPGSEPDYVNQARHHQVTSRGRAEPPGDRSAFARPHPQAPRQADSTRANLELPERARDQVRAIKSELGRLQERDAAASATGSTYKRYDVT